MKAGTYKITINGISNPSAGGTGMFKLQSRRRKGKTTDVNLLDYNHIFGQVGISPTPPLLTGVNSIPVSYIVNVITDYTISFTTAKAIPAGGRIEISIEAS